MTKRKGEAKKPVTIRANPESVERLKVIAREQGKTVSSLIDRAIEEFLSGEPTKTTGEFLIYTKDLEALLPVVKTFTLAVPLSMVLDIIKLQRGGKDSPH